MLNVFPVYPLSLDFIWVSLDDNFDLLVAKKQFKNYLSETCEIIKDNPNFDFKPISSNISGFNAKCGDFLLTAGFISSPIFKEIRLNIILPKSEALSNLSDVISFIKGIKNKILSHEGKINKKMSVFKLGLVFQGIPTLETNLSSYKIPDWVTGIQNKVFFLKKESLLGFSINIGIEPIIESESLSIRDYRFVIDGSMLLRHKDIIPPNFSFEYFLKSLENLSKEITENNFKEAQ